MRDFEVRELGLLGYQEAWAVQRRLAEQRKKGEIPDQLLLLEHPHVLTLGRNAHLDNIVSDRRYLADLGVDVVEIDRGGDVTYHGPGQIVGYPIFDLREWKRDVVAYVRAVEESILRALAGLGVTGEREPGATGVWVNGAKICAIGIHISRWVTTHGFALNWTTDLSYFRHIIPCGLEKPVTSLEQLGVFASRAAVHGAIVTGFAEVFDLRPAILTAAS